LLNRIRSYVTKIRLLKQILFPWALGIAVFSSRGLILVNSQRQGLLKQQAEHLTKGKRKWWWFYFMEWRLAPK
jgi:hypothetical protein